MSNVILAFLLHCYAATFAGVPVQPWESLHALASNRITPWKRHEILAKLARQKEAHAKLDCEIKRIEANTKLGWCRFGGVMRPGRAS